MTTFNVIQIGTQREVLVGTVDAADTDEAQMKAYQAYGDSDDKDLGYDSFRVETKAVTFNEAACEALHQEFEGEEFTTKNGADFFSDHKHIQILPFSDIASFVRNHDPEADDDKIQEARDDARNILVTYDQDEFNTGSEIFAMSDQKTGELL